MKKVIKTMMFSLGVNTLLSIFKIVAGFLGASGALIADGFHSFSDLSTDLIAIFGNKMSLKPADEKHPFGHGKISYITSIFISVVILIVGLSVIISSLQKEIVIPSFYVGVVSILTIVSKYILANYVIKVGKAEKNPILLASGYESRADVLSSVVVFISIICMQLSKWISILKFADVIAMILVGLFILKTGFELLKENVSSILEEQETDEEVVKQIEKEILKFPYVLGIDSLKVLKYGVYFKVELEVSMNPFSSLLKTHQHLHELEHALKEFDDRIYYVTIHANPHEAFTLEKAQESDFKKILEYRCHTMEEKNKKEMNYMKEYIKENTHLENYQLIKIHEEICGTIGIKKEKEKEIMLEELYIEDAYRHCGIGTKIIKNLQANHSQISLWVKKENIHAITFWEKLGFQKQQQEEQDKYLYIWKG